MENKKKHSWGKWVVGGLYLLLGGFVGYAGSAYIRQIFGCQRSVTGRIWTVGLLLLIFYASVFAHVVIHEVGHLIGGRQSGYELESFRIGRWMLVKKEGHLRWKRFSLPGTAGQCLMAPPEPYQVQMPVLLYNLGGSLGNFLAALLCLLLYFAGGRNTLFSGVFLIFAGTGIVFALHNAIPMESASIYNDGHNALVLRNDEASRRCFWLQLQMNKMLSRDVRLKDMPKEWFVLPGEEERKKSLCASVAVLCFMRLMDEMQFVEAQRLGRYLLEDTEGMTTLQQNVLHLELLFCEIVTEGRDEIVEELLTQELKKAMKLLRHQLCVQRIQYAYALLIQRKEEEAQKHLEAFEKIAKTYPHACEIQGEKELIAYVKEKYEKGREEDYTRN